MIAPKGAYIERVLGGFNPPNQILNLRQIEELLMADKGKKEGLLIGQGKQLIAARKNFTIRLSEEEREQAEYDACSNNMKLSHYVRYLIRHGGRVDTSLTYDRRDLV